jgi:hypothetical protein
MDVLRQRQGAGRFNHHTPMGKGQSLAPLVLLPHLFAKQFIFEMEPPVALTTIGSAVREGFDGPEKVALRQIRSGRLNRVAVHRQYAQISPYVVAPQPAES